MNMRARVARCGVLIVVVPSFLLAGCAGSAVWPQWGGPSQNFVVEAKGLADAWPEEGPEKIWHRELGDGYATIVADKGALYTMYRTEEDEFTVALNAKTGETLWEYKCNSPFTELMAQFGPGPHSTPLIAGQRLYTIGTNGVMHCFDKKSGEVLWKHDLPEAFGAPIPGRGYGCSPMAYNDLVIVPVDRDRPREEGQTEEKAEDQADKAEGQTLIAFDQATGDVVWKSQDFPINYASPILINFEGEDQIVLLMQSQIMGVSPADGQLLWAHEVDPAGANLATPLWFNGNMLFCSSAYDSGSRLIKLTKKDGKTVPEELWYTRKLRIHHANAHRIGDQIVGSSGDFGAAFLVALDIETGKRAWLERGFAKATCLKADGKLILLDEDGQLALATVTPEGITVHSKCKIAERYAWAAPTLVGTTLYVRDRTHIMALDLG